MSNSFPWYTCNPCKLDRNVLSEWGDLIAWYCPHCGDVAIEPELKSLTQFADRVQWRQFRARWRYYASKEGFLQAYKTSKPPDSGG